MRIRKEKRTDLIERRKKPKGKRGEGKERRVGEKSWPSIPFLLKVELVHQFFSGALARLGQAFSA